MTNKKTTLFAFSLMLITAQTNAGFFDNLADNLQNGDIGGLLTDVVKDVAQEAQKSNDTSETFGTSFGSITSYDEDEYTESKEEIETKSETLTSTTEVNGSELEVGCFFCAEEDKKKTRYKNGDIFTGRSIITRENGEVVKIDFVDGLNLHQFIYYPSGQLKTEDYRDKKGLNQGLARSWHENGALQAETYFKNNEMTGVQKFWHENGQLAFKSETGKKCDYFGLYEKWYENGNKKVEKTYSNECLSEGLSQKWYENGNQKFKAYYTKGNEHGLTQEWYENGNKKKEQSVENGQIQFPYTMWHDNGEVSMIHHGFPLAISGAKFPAYDKFYENGNLKESHKIIGNYRSLEMFYENGNQRQSMLVNVYGQPHQYQNAWHENGEIKFEEFYVEGDRKMQTMWDEDGSVLETNDTGFRYSMVVELEDLAKQ
jgi:antitoxin component YwqK of YwqJK toxin-antitoxin module